MHSELVEGKSMIITFPSKDYIKDNMAIEIDFSKFAVSFQTVGTNKRKLCLHSTRDKLPVKTSSRLQEIDKLENGNTVTSHNCHLHFLTILYINNYFDNIILSLKIFLN